MSAFDCLADVIAEDAISPTSVGPDVRFLCPATMNLLRIPVDSFYASSASGEVTH
jgi:hypothetical protein